MGFLYRGFNQSKDAISFKPGINMYVNKLKENISYHTSCLTIAIIVCKDQDNLHSSIKVFGKIIFFFLKLIVGLNVSVFLLL